MILSINNQEDLNSLVASLALEIVDANIYHRLLHGLSNSLDENHRAYIQSKTYWYLTTESLKDSVLICLCRFYDQEKKSLCLYNLLETIKHYVSFFDKDSFKQRLQDNPFVETLAEIDRLPDLKQLDIDIEFSSDSNPVVKKLIIWRNNIIVHRGSKNVLKNNGTLEKHPLTMDEIDSLLDEGFKILNRYLYLYKASSWSRQIVGHDDFKSVFTFMNLGLDKWDIDRKAELERLRKRQHSVSTIIGGGMKTTINDIVRRLRVLSDLEKKESDEIKKMYGLEPEDGLEIGSEAADGIMTEPRPIDGALTGFLDYLPPNLLSAIVVLMYAGRDGDTDIFEAIIRLKHIWKSKEHSINAITDKRPRMEYINEGLKKLNPRDFDKFIEAFPISE